MGYLFDPDKPYFAAWLQLHNIERPTGATSLNIFMMDSASDSPLYYATLCGFQDLVEDLVIKYPQHVNAMSGYHVTPFVAALAEGHSQTAKYDNCAHLNVPGCGQRTPLHSAAWYGDLEMVRYYSTTKLTSMPGPITTGPHCTKRRKYMNSSQNLSRLPDVARSLLERGTDVNVLDGENRTPLYVATRDGRSCVRAVRAWCECRCRGQGRQYPVPDCVGEGIHQDCGVAVGICKDLLKFDPYDPYATSLL